MFSLKAIIGLLALAFAIYYARTSSVQPHKHGQSDRGHDSKGSQKASLDALDDDDYYEILELDEDASTEDIRCKEQSNIKRNARSSLHMIGRRFGGCLVSITLTRICKIRRDQLRGLPK